MSDKKTEAKPVDDEDLEDVAGGNWFTDIFTAKPPKNPRAGEFIEGKGPFGGKIKIQIQD